MGHLKSKPYQCACVHAHVCTCVRVCVRTYMYVWYVSRDSLANISKSLLFANSLHASVCLSGDQLFCYPCVPKFSSDPQCGSHLPSSPDRRCLSFAHKATEWLLGQPCFPLCSLWMSNDEILIPDLLKPREISITSHRQCHRLLASAQWGMRLDPWALLEGALPALGATQLHLLYGRSSTQTTYKGERHHPLVLITWQQFFKVDIGEKHMPCSNKLA